MLVSLSGLIRFLILLKGYEERYKGRMHTWKCWFPARAGENEISLMISYRQSMQGTEVYIWKAVSQGEMPCLGKAFFSHFDLKSASFVILIQTLHAFDQLTCLQMS